MAGQKYKFYHFVIYAISFNILSLEMFNTSGKASTARVFKYLKKKIKPEVPQKVFVTFTDALLFIYLSLWNYLW